MSAGTLSRPHLVGRLPRLTKTHVHHATRGALVLILATLGLFVIGCMAFGFIEGGARTALGTALAPHTHQHVALDSRLISGGDYTLVSVTPAGAAAGYAPGQIVNMTQWSLAQKLAFAYPKPATANQLRLHQGLQATAMSEAYSAKTRTQFYDHALNILVRLILLCSALLIVQFGHGRAALAAGLYLAAAAMADALTMTFAGLPASIQAVALVVASLSRPAAYAFRFAFSMEFCPGSNTAKIIIWAVFGVLLSVVATLSLGELATILFNAPVLPVSPLLMPLAQSATQLYSLGIFAAAAIACPPGHRFVLRIIFFATLITLASYIIQECYLLADTPPPGWMNWYFNTALLGAGIGYPWAIFARRIAGVDFVISRGVAYALSIGLILVLIELAKLAAQALAGDWINGDLLLYGTPVVLAVSLNWLQGKMTGVIEMLLDGDLRNAAKTLHALEADFPQTPNLEALATMVAARAAPALHMDGVTIHLNHTEPPTSEGGLLFPLDVFGRTLGVLHCGARPHGKGFDPAERALLAELAREIAVAVVCLEPSRLQPNPAASSITASLF